MSDKKEEPSNNAIEALHAYLSDIDHEDPDKHYIGATLPVATDAELRPVGISTTAGTSVFPARADHVHGIKSPYSVAYTSAPVTIPNGGARYYINNWSWGSGEDWVGASPQTIDFPYTGLYLLNFYLKVEHDTVAAGLIGAGFFHHGLSFNGGAAIYQFTDEYVEAAQAYVYDDVCHGHLAGDPSYVEYWCENYLPVNVQASLQFVGVFLSGL